MVLNPTPSSSSGGGKDPSGGGKDFGRRKRLADDRCLRVLEIPTLSASSVSDNRADSCLWLTLLVKNGTDLFSLLPLLRYRSVAARNLIQEAGFVQILYNRLGISMVLCVCVCVSARWITLFFVRDGDFFLSDLFIFFFILGFRLIFKHLNTGSWCCRSYMLCLIFKYICLYNL